jgi:hypothetical protein
MAQRFFYRDVAYYDQRNVELSASFVVDSTQTANTANYLCSSVQGSGIAHILNVGTGVYKVVLSDTYQKYSGMDVSTSGLLGTQVAIASLSNSTPYVIKTMGTSAQADWVTAGLDNSVTAAVGVAFVAGSGASGATGTGYAAPIITAAGNTKFQIYGNPDTTINVANGGSPYFFFQCLDATNSSTTTQIATAMTDQTVVKLKIRLRNFGAKATGE